MSRIDNPPIGFSEEDARRLHHPHDDALVVTIQAGDYNIHRVLVDNGSSADILYYPAFQQMGIGRERLVPTNAPLIGFGGAMVFPLGVVTLAVTIGDYSQRITKNVVFLVVDCSSAYNAIIGRPTLNSWKAAINIEERRVATEPVERLEDVPLDESHPEQTTKISTLAEPMVPQELETFLKENRDVFAWSHEDMPGIDPSVMVHRLNVSPSVLPIRQKKRIFAQERDQAVAEEVRKLQEAGFIKEVYYPDWLANVVMVKKNNGKWRMCVDFTNLNQACPKDSYPLLRVNILVDFTAQHQLLSFMDAFSGYNQIRIDEEAHEQDVCTTDWKKPPSICQRHAS
ncbi:uncharacterized protein LOC142639543 [Castanea sativa]|uniref:uncharacterized protein LOC142639543 n=1 Tax=Castanea sativa TaxID=21020 RepID=UPI003F6513CF